MIADKFAVQMRAALVVAALTGLVWPAQAQQPSAAAVATAMQVIKLKGADRMFSPLVAGIISKIKDTLLQTNLTLSKDLNDVALKLAGDYNPRLAELTRYTAQLYASRFTEKELKEIAAFYRSPLGKKVIDQEPKILDQSMANADAWARKMEQEIFQKFRAEMKKKGHDL